MKKKKSGLKTLEDFKKENGVPWESMMHSKIKQFKKHLKAYVDLAERKHREGHAYPWEEEDSDIYFAE